MLFRSGGNFAYLASGGGWKTSIVLTNTGTKAGAAHLKFFDTAGAALSLPVSFPQIGGNATPLTTVDQTLAPGATLLIESGALTGALLTGSAQFTTDGNISGFVISRNLVNNQEAVVPIESRNANAYLLAFDNTAGTFTGVAMSSTSTKSQPLSVGIVIRDDTGAQIASDTIQLPANGLRAFTLAFDKYPETSGLRGTIEFTPPAGEQISVLGIRQPLAGTLTTLPALIR